MAAEAVSGARLTELELLEIQPHEPALGGDVAARLSRRLRLPCRVSHVPGDFDVPHLPGRDQVDADRLLAAVEALDGPPGSIRVALTGRDIGHPIFTHFFGRARHGGSAVLVSSKRLDPRFYGMPADAALTIRRAVLEVLHELGHIAGLAHCELWDCVMRFAPNVEALDNRGDSYCPRCALQLPASLANARS